MTTTTRRVLPLLATLALILAACGPQTAPASAPAASGAAQPAPAVTPAAAPGAGAQAATAAPPQPPIQLKVGTQRLSSDAPLYAADERGYFTEQGLDVEFVEIGAGAASIPSLAAGQFDVGVGSINPALYNAIARGIDIKLVATKGSTPPVAEGSLIGSQALVLAADVAASGAIQDYADLRGKSVALPDRGSTLERALHKALERGGLTIEDVEIKLLAYADMLPALSNRSVDAAMELEPFIAQGAARGILVPWKRGTELYPGQQATAVIFGPTMAQIGGNAGGRLMVAYTRGLRDYHEAFGPRQRNRADMVALLVRNTSLKDTALYDQMGAGYMNPNCYLNTETMDADVDWYVANGYVPQKPDLAQAIDNRYCDYAIQQLGRYQP